MATYYVRNDGSNSNAGTGPATNQAWQTVTYALANMVLTTGTNYLYIAPGAYREAPTVTITPSSTQTLVISGDPTASQFSGVTSGVVRLTNFTSDTANPGNSNILTISGKTYITITGLHFDIYTSSSNYAINGATNPDNIIIEKCTFQGHDAGGFASWGINFVHSSIVQNITVQKCVFNRCYIGIYFESSASAGTSQQFTSTDCLFIGCDIGSFYITGNGINRKIQNCTFVNFVRNAVAVLSAQASGTSVTNCLFSGGATALTTSGVGITENYNRFISCSPRTNVSPSGANSVTGGVTGVDIGYALLTGIANQQMFSTLLNSPNFNFGTTSGAPVSDMYGVTWTGANPDAGSATYRSLSGVGNYNPTERNISSVAIVPNSTSQSIELYLGATGLIYNTSGLSAYYIRNRSSPVQISLISQTPTGSWASGGFAEISSANAPGLYRLDVPDAAFASGSDDVTIVVRGASGTNGAVVTCTLFSPTANLLNTQAGIYTSAGTLGARLLQTVADNRPVIVTSDNQIQVDAGQTFSSGSGTTILSPILNSVGRWTLEGSTLTLYNADGTYLRRCNLTQLGLSLSPT